MQSCLPLKMGNSESATSLDCDITLYKRETLLELRSELRSDALLAIIIDFSGIHTHDSPRANRVLPWLQAGTCHGKSYKEDTVTDHKMAIKNILSGWYGIINDAG